VKETPQIASIILVNKLGNIELAVHDKRYEGWMDYNRSLADSEAFRQLKEREDLNLYVGPSTGNDSRKSNLIVVARRIYNIDGTFGGIVLATIHSEYFLDFFKSVDVGARRSMSLMLDDGRDLLKGTRHSRSNPALFAKVNASILRAARDKPGSTATRLEQVGGALQMLSSRYVPQLPLVVSVAIDERDFLNSFWSDRAKDFAFLGVFTVFGSVLSFFALAMARQIMRVEESESAAILASQAKSEFLANMSHELRTPLNAIIGFSEMMNAGYFGPLNSKQKERMQDINLCGNHLLHLINDILEFSKGEAGKLELVEEKVSLSEVAAEVTRMMGEKLKSKGLRLVTEVEPHLPLVFADKRKLKQILLNLMSNAVKFTPRGGDIKFSARLESNGSLSLAVADTGVGIAEEDIPRALSVFGQVHRSHNHEGTGLGLPLCRMFAELHGGKLALSSTVGEGTTVRVLFPAQRVIRDESEPGAARAAS
jgi:signal transduction histidine kinase